MSTTEEAREVVMLMTAGEVTEFGLKVARLQEHYGGTTVVDTVRRAVDEAVERM